MFEKELQKASKDTVSERKHSSAIAWAVSNQSIRDMKHN